MAMTLLTTNTESGDATSSFTSGIDSTYKLYIFKFLDVNPATDDSQFVFQANAAGASGYNETMTTTAFRSIHNEADDEAALTYRTDRDQAQGTAFQVINDALGGGSDECLAGTLWLFNPSNTTYVKHFYSRTNCLQEGDVSFEFFVAGYFNTTTAIDDIQFKMSSGDMDAVIKMYGVG